VYIPRLILFKEFLNVANEEKFTILEGKLFQTFATRSLKFGRQCTLRPGPEMLDYEENK